MDDVKPLSHEASEILTALELLLATVRFCGAPLAKGADASMAHPDSICVGNLRTAIRAQKIADKYTL